MIFNIMTAVVFLAELIIAYTIIKKLLEIDKIVLKANEALTLINPGIKDIGCLIKKISAQCVEFSYDFVSKIRKKQEDSIISYLNKIIIAIILLKINSKFIRKIIRSKHFKMLTKGFSLLKYVV